MRQRQIHLEDNERATIRDMLSDLKYELIPLKNVHDQAAFLPERAMVSVTASPAKGMEATIDLALYLAAAGHRVIPHLSARLTKDRAELEGYLKRLDEAEITRAFVVGGDADPPGEFFDAMALLTAMEEIGHGITDIGIGAYPEGHPKIPDDLLQQALVDKRRYATSMTTQMCFEPSTIDIWLRRQRRQDNSLPAYIGIPGVAELRKLIGISARIGVGDSMRFLSKNTSLVGRLVRPGGYSPDALILGLAPTLVDADADVHGFHVYTFNQVETTEQWRVEMLESL